MKAADDLWAEIHFKQDSIPSIVAGPLTEKSRKQLYDLCVAVLPERTKWPTENKAYNLAIDQSIEALKDIFDIREDK